MFVDTLYEEFEESTVLHRVFGTVAFLNLPESDKHIVKNLATTRGCSGELKEETIVVSLLGTRGKKAIWNDRFKSVNHRGIPLLSASFIKTIPMIAALMIDTGKGIDWIAKQRTKILVKTFGQMARLVYVDDAESAVTGEGFKTVPAQDFVRDNRVRTVIGLGGAYLDRTFVSVLFFTDETISLEQAKKFMPLVNTFKTATTGHVMSGRIFDSIG
jgi:hypothetical protein